MHAGKWITGKIGTNKILAVSEKLDIKTVEHVNSITKHGFSSYFPWMTCERNLYYFASSKLTQTSQFISNVQYLDFLSQGFSYNGFPLGSLLIEEKEGLYLDCYKSENSQHFIKSIKKALDWIFDIEPSFKTRWQSLVMEILPLALSNSKKSEIGRGLSSHCYRKGVFIQLPKESSKAELRLALNLVHELGHQALMVYQNADEIISSDQNFPIYSIVRKTLRPAIRSFHAFVVTGYMLELLTLMQSTSKTGQYTLSEISEELLKCRRLVLLAAQEFKSSGVQFTDLGKEIIDEFQMLALIGN